MRCKGKTIWAAVLALLLAGCVQPAPAPSRGNADTAGETGATANPPGFRKLTLERTACFGACPVYRVTIHADGRVEYEGTQWVEVRGKREGRADPESLAELREALAGLELEAKHYQYGKPACGQFMTDMPGARITIVRPAGEQRYSFNEGCTATPDELKRLAERIDRAARTGRWIGGSTGDGTTPAEPRQ